MESLTHWMAQEMTQFGMKRMKRTMEVVDNEFETDSEREEQQNVPAAKKIKRLFPELTRFFSEPPC